MPWSAFTSWPSSSEQRMRRALALKKPPFGCSISHIVELCSQEKMDGVAASPIVASVTNANTFRNGASRNEEGNAMRPRPLHFVFAVSVLRLRVEPFFPIPAFIKATNINILKKTLLKWWLFGPFSVGSLCAPFNSILVGNHAPIMASCYLPSKGDI